jgi:hypothetical protein
MNAKLITAAALLAVASCQPAYAWDGTQRGANRTFHHEQRMDALVNQLHNYPTRQRSQGPTVVTVEPAEAEERAAREKRIADWEKSCVASVTPDQYGVMRYTYTNPLCAHGVAPK